jgi:hypothetical protein
MDVSDPAKAAEIFDKMSTSREAITACDRFRVRVTAGHEVEMAVNAIVKSEGFVVANKPADGVIRAATALCSVYSAHGGDVLRQTLQMIRASWGEDVNAMEAAIIRGYGAFLAGHGEKLNRKRFAQRLTKDYSPGKLIGEARTLADLTRTSVGVAVTKVLIMAHDVGLRKGRIGN